MSPVFRVDLNISERDKTELEDGGRPQPVEGLVSIMTWRREPR